MRRILVLRAQKIKHLKDLHPRPGGGPFSPLQPVQIFVKENGPSKNQSKNQNSKKREWAKERYIKSKGIFGMLVV